MCVAVCTTMRDVEATCCYDPTDYPRSICCFCGYTSHPGGVLAIDAWEAYVYADDPEAMAFLEEWAGYVWIDTWVDFKEKTTNKDEEEDEPYGSHTHSAHDLAYATLSLWWYNPWGTPGNYWEPTDYYDGGGFYFNRPELEEWAYPRMYFRRPGMYAVVYQVRDAGGNWNIPDPDPDHYPPPPHPYGDYYPVYVFAPRDCAASVWRDYVGTGVDNWSNFIYWFLDYGGWDVGDYAVAYPNSHGWGPDRDFVAPPTWFKDPDAGVCNMLTLFAPWQSASATSIQPAYVPEVIPEPWERAYGYRTFLASGDYLSGGELWGTLTTVSFVQRLGIHWMQMHGLQTLTPHDMLVDQYNEVIETWPRIAIGRMSNVLGCYELPNGHTRMKHRGAHFEVAYPIKHPWTGVPREPTVNPQPAGSRTDDRNQYLSPAEDYPVTGFPDARYDQQAACDLINAICYCWRGDHIPGTLNTSNIIEDFNWDEGWWKNMMYDLPGDEGWPGPDEQIWIYVHDDSGLDWDPQGPGDPGYPYDFAGYLGLQGVRIISESDEGAGVAGNINEFTDDKMIVVLPDPLDNEGDPFPPCEGDRGEGAGGEGDLDISLEDFLASGFDLTGFPQPELLMDNVPDMTLEDKLEALGVNVCTNCGPPKHD